MTQVQACRTAIHDIWKANGNKRTGVAHAGLVLASCLQQQDSPEERGRVFREAPRAVERTHALYAEAFHRWKGSLGAGGCGSLQAKDPGFYVHGRMVVGLGGHTVLETGLTLHHTYGTPIIPGSALKGLASHYCDQIWGQQDSGFKAPPQSKGDREPGHKRPTTYFEILFGTQETAGYITFHDAWITPETLRRSLCLDVMTPHHSEYYSGGDSKAAPTDFDDPVPISFLSVKGVFHVALGCDIPGDEGSRWAKLAFELLTQALENWGIGAKTNAGYGRMGEKATQPLIDRAVAPEERGVQKQSKPPKLVSRGARIRVKRIEDPKGRNRLFFEAEDGIRCQVQQADDPAKEVPIGEEIELWVANTQAELYTLSSEKPREKKATQKKRPRR